MTEAIYNTILNTHSSNQKSLSLLIDPDVYDDNGKITGLLTKIEDCQVDYLFIGGSILKNPDISLTVEFLKQNTKYL